MYDGILFADVTYTHTHTHYVNARFVGCVAKHPTGYRSLTDVRRIAINVSSWKETVTTGQVQRTVRSRWGVVQGLCSVPCTQSSENRANVRVSILLLSPHS